MTPVLLPSQITSRPNHHLSYCPLYVCLFACICGLGERRSDDASDRAVFFFRGLDVMGTHSRMLTVLPIELMRPCLAICIIFVLVCMAASRISGLRFDDRHPKYVTVSPILAFPIESAFAAVIALIRCDISHPIARTQYLLISHC